MSQTQTPLIEFINVSKSFGAKKVLERMNLQIYEGEVTTIIGLSGGGKSVLLKHIIGLLEPDEGTILFRGRPVTGTGRQGVFAQGEINYMFQGNALFDSMTVFDNVALPLNETTNLSKREIAEKVMTRLRETELADTEYKFPAELSGGMQKRVALARALITDPKIVLFDEPTSGQDPVRKNAILGMIAQYQRKFGFTAILVSHEIPDVYFISNRILALYDKQIVFQGAPDDLENFDHPFTREVIHSIEGLQAELTGLHSRRRFKLLYHNELKKFSPGKAYTIVLFSLNYSANESNEGERNLVEDAMQKMGRLINKHFDSVGGFSTRYRASQFITVLPDADMGETSDILKLFVADLEDGGEPDGEKLTDFGGEFSVMAGLAEGHPSLSIEEVVQSAQERQAEIARMSLSSGVS
ncbi:MAG: ATP-binding cassette domain-containing protein [Syntrophobacterales bacterium]|jgi:phospholipid/cholesterol/gamma-HCH transport system ATP-binding protein|nr:ATP-binding cassette domain-containing protein [Syntrophobacterales bacterium]